MSRGGPFKIPGQYLEDFFFSTTSHRDSGMPAVDLNQGLLLD